MGRAPRLRHLLQPHLQRLWLVERLSLGDPCIATDQFVLPVPSGTAELVATSAGAATYRPKIEEGYTQVTKDTVNNTWPPISDPRISWVS